MLSKNIKINSVSFYKLFPKNTRLLMLILVGDFNSKIGNKNTTENKRFCLIQ
jgi:hypothetical protein